MIVSLNYCEACGRVQQHTLPVPHAIPGTRGHRRCNGTPQSAVFHSHGDLPVPDLIGVALASELLGVSKAGGLQRLREAGRMPEPVAGPPEVAVPVYLRSDIDRLGEELRAGREARRAS
jgi:hypothetical protein